MNLFWSKSCRALQQKQQLWIKQWHQVHRITFPHCWSNKQIKNSCSVQKRFLNEAREKKILFMAFIVDQICRHFVELVNVYFSANCSDCLCPFQDWLCIILSKIMPLSYSCCWRVLETLSSEMLPLHGVVLSEVHFSLRIHHYSKPQLQSFSPSPVLTDFCII